VTHQAFLPNTFAARFPRVLTGIHTCSVLWRRLVKSSSKRLIWLPQDAWFGHTAIAMMARLIGAAGPGVPKTLVARVVGKDVFSAGEAGVFGLIRARPTNGADRGLGTN